MTLRVLLGSRVVGHLQERPDHNGVAFRPDLHWAEDIGRPILGQQFEDDPYRTHSTRGPALPTWFSNLLPEGILRDELLRGTHYAGNPEWSLIRRLGADLPGAVVVQPLADTGNTIPADELSAEDDGVHGSDNPTIKFSLAGVQLKFSALRQGRRFVLPAGGTGGEWIVKTPDRRYPGVPQNEFLTMEWARAAGFDVPETRLVDRADLVGLDERWEFPRDEQAFAIQRFDRTPGSRIHMEDFAQVFGVRPHEKYKRANYETLVMAVHQIAGPAQALEMVRRLVFVVASANADAHLKNWTLLYPNPRTPVLSPVYDQVVTAAFIPEDSLALNLARSKAWADVSIESFLRLARKVELQEQDVANDVKSTVERVREALNMVRAEYPVHTQDVLERHWRTVPLLAGR